MPKTATLSASVVLAVACVGQAAHAQSFNYTDFSAASLAANPALTINGNANVNSADNELQLTPATYGQAGSAFSTALIPLNNQDSFSTEFSFQLSNVGGIGDEDGTGADGFVFTLQTVSNNVGTSGGGIGYQGISPSIAVEFDTFNNGGSDNNDGNKVTIDENGDVSVADALAYSHAPTGGANFPTRFNNGNVWYSWVDYNGATQEMDVRYNSVNVRPTAPFISATGLNLASVLGQPSAFAGFTASTGSGYEDQDILSWQFNNTFSPIGVAAVPEPSDLAFLACGVPLAALALRRRKRA